MFNIVEIPEGDGRAFARKGICTGMLEKLCQGMLDNDSHRDFKCKNYVGDEDITDTMENLCVKEYKPKVTNFFC